MRHITTYRGAAALALGGLLTVALDTAFADVTIEERLTVEGVGAMSLADMSGTTTRIISGDRAREESHIRMKSRLVRFFAHGAGDTHTAEVVRLDEDRLVTLDLDKREYTETSLAARRAELQQALDRAGADRQGAAAAPTGMDESQCEWSDPRVEVARTGRTARIAGLDAQETSIMATQSCTDRKTGSVCDVALWMDMWLAPDFAGSEEALRFGQAYARKMGFADASSREATQRVEALFSRYKGAWQQAAGKMRDLKGYPVRSRFALGFGGPQCREASGSATSASAGSAQSAPSGADLEQATAQEAGRTAGESAAARTGFGALAGRLGGEIAGGLFARHRKQAASSSASSAPAQAGAEADPLAAKGYLVPLRYTLELVSVDSRPASADAFEVPPGFKKVDSLH